MTWIPSSIRSSEPWMGSSSLRGTLVLTNPTCTKPPSSIHNGRYWPKSTERLPPAKSTIKQFQSQAEYADRWIWRKALCSSSAWSWGRWERKKATWKVLEYIFQRKPFAYPFPRAHSKMSTHFHHLPAVPFHILVTLMNIPFNFSIFWFQSVSTSALQGHPPPGNACCLENNLWHQHSPNHEVFIRCLVKHMMLWSNFGKTEWKQTYSRALNMPKCTAMHGNMLGGGYGSSKSTWMWNHVIKG